MNEKKIFVVYDSVNCDTVAAANSMDLAVRLAIRFMFAHDYHCENFSYDEDMTVIEYANIYRIGGELRREEGVLSITCTTLYEADE